MPKTRPQTDLTTTDEEFASLGRVKELMDQQKDMFKELLHQQQDNFKSFITIIMETNNTRIDSLSKDIQELKTSLQYTQAEVDTLKNNNVKNSEQTNSIQTDVYKVCESLLTISDKLDYIEGQSRRNNLVFEGVAESPGETWTDAEEKIKKLLSEKLQIQHAVEVERAHRVGRPDHGRDRPRPIVAKLLRWKDRETVLQRAKRLKGTNVFINEDYTEAVKRKRKELMPQLRAAREQGNIAFLRHDKLIVHPRTSTPNPV